MTLRPNNVWPPIATFVCKNTIATAGLSTRGSCRALDVNCRGWTSGRADGKGGSSGGGGSKWAMTSHFLEGAEYPLPPTFEVEDKMPAGEAKDARAQRARRASLALKKGGVNVRESSALQKIVCLLT